MDKDDARIAPVIERLGNYLMQPVTGCELCEAPGGELLWEDDFCRIVLVTDADYPGFCRVILREHVREMTDLPVAAQTRLMRAVLATESAVRSVYCPDKINLASFGNVVPHLHWHVIPRWHDDRHFPQPIWGTPQRVSSPARPPVSSHHLAVTIAARLAADKTKGDAK
jgi:diadenosine tetraphosphate (Ap4A) HIT family hydrolase